MTVGRGGRSSPALLRAETRRVRGSCASLARRPCLTRLLAAARCNRSGACRRGALIVGWGRGGCGCPVLCLPPQAGVVRARVRVVPGPGVADGGAVAGVAGRAGHADRRAGAGIVGPVRAVAGLEARGRVNPRGTPRGHRLRRAMTRRRRGRSAALVVAGPGSTMVIRVPRCANAPTPTPVVEHALGSAGAAVLGWPTRRWCPRNAGRCSTCLRWR